MMVDSIQHALLGLRAQPQPLTNVADAACVRAGLYPECANESQLATAFQLVVRLVEEEGHRLSQSHQELAYHNRAHVADALTSLACLLAVTPGLSAEDKWLSLIVMTGHDFGHQGKTNHQLGYSQEEMTAAWLRQALLGLLSPQQINRMSVWVVGTDPSLVASNHLTYRSHTNDVDALLQVLINEADIAASLIPDLALGLTRQLLIERGQRCDDSAEVQAFYEGFRSQALVSSPSAQRLLSNAPQTAGLQGVAAPPNTFFKQSYPAKVEAIGEARKEVIQAIGSHKPLPQALADVEIALGEVLQNIVRHGRFPDQIEKKFTIEAVRHQQNLSIRVLDMSQPLKDLGFLEREHAASDQGGMGLGLIRKTSTKYYLSPLNQGNFHQLDFESVFRAD